MAIVVDLVIEFVIAPSWSIRKARRLLALGGIISDREVTEGKCEDMCVMKSKLLIMYLGAFFLFVLSKAVKTS